MDKHDKVNIHSTDYKYLVRFHLCEKLDRRLSGWKVKYLSLAGRITLAKSTVSTLAFNSMQSAKIPKLTCDELDKRTCRFIWGGDEEKRKIHLISWKTIQKPREHGGLGVRSAKQMNAAFMTKLGWRVLTEPNALWSRVLRHKYCKGRCDIDMFGPMSNVWKGISEVASTIHKGAAVAVGNARRTLFWDHAWAMDKPLNAMALYTVPDHLVGATVDKMWTTNDGWNWEIFAHLLPNVALKHIASHELVDDPDVGDLLYRKNGNQGKFSIKHALQLSRQDDEVAASKDWSTIWQAPVQQRIRAFLWVLMHDRLLCNANRLKRHLTDDTRCTRCGGAEETLLHLFQDCKISRQIWKNVGGVVLYNSFYIGSLHEWVICNLRADDFIYHETWPTCFAITLWWVWRWRNAEVLGREVQQPYDVGAFIHSLTQSTWKAIKEANMGSPSLGRHEITIKWRAPLMGWFMLNSDGAAKGSPRLARGGGVIRDWRGKFIKGFSANFGYCSSYKAELKAVAYGLDMANLLNIKQLVINMDNLACVQSIDSDEYNGGECYHILNHCRKMIKMPHWKVKVEHCYREGNRVADWLANKGVEQEEQVIIIQDIKAGLGKLLSEDLAGVALPRPVPN